MHVCVNCRSVGAQLNSMKKGQHGALLHMKRFVHVRIKDQQAERRFH